jgi:hypothetical protein
MKLLLQLLALLEGWKPVFPQARTHQRAVAHALAAACTLGRRTLSRSIVLLGRAQKDWSADYKIFSRCRWRSQDLFTPVLTDYLHRYPQGPLTVALDDTKLPKTGKKIPTAFWQRDPLSPPFRFNLLYGLRFLQASLIFPHHQEGEFSARALPVRFHEAPTVSKPGRRASAEAQKEYRRLQKLKNLSTQSLAWVRELRSQLDALGAAARLLLLTVDGSFCNQTFFKAALERVELLARARKDARLCLPAAPGSRRRYAAEIFTPDQVRQDEARPWQLAKVFYGGRRREVRHKEVAGVLWRRGAGVRLLRLIVVAPLPYRLSPHARLNYRQPAYLLTTDRASTAALLLQAYLDRWQIEVNHRDEKSLLGVGQAQVRSALSVPRQPALVVAAYSLLLLAALRAFGPTRTSDYLPLPKWRKPAARPSLLDILALLRQQINETSVSSLGGVLPAQTLIGCAST